MKASKFLLIFASMALIPFVAAYVVLKTGFYSAGETAKGEFLSEDVIIQELKEPPYWQVVYQPSGQCAELCQQQIYALTQIPKALGKKAKLVKTKVLSEQNSKLYRQLEVAPLSSDKLSGNYLYLVDPFGVVVLRYSASESREVTIGTSKKVLADIKKLLNYSRVG